jgi:hypothetical protein
MSQLSLYMPGTRLGATFSDEMDGMRITNKTAKVLKLLLDEQPHTIAELRAVGGTQGDRRARDLRDARYGSFQVDVTRDPEDPTSGLWFYRIVAPTREQVRIAWKALGVSEVL